MKQVYTFLLVLLTVVSCNSVKKTTTAVHSGDYDQAISIALDKLRKNPEKKKKQPYILLLEEACVKAVDRDLARIAFLQKEGNAAKLEEIYETYETLKNRQERIKPILPLRLIKEGRDAQFLFKNYDTEILSSKAALTDFLYTDAKRVLSSAKAKNEFRKAHADLEYLNTITPGHKDVNQLMQDAHFKGTDFVSVEMYNDTEVIIPRDLETDLLDFSTYDLNDFWTAYHSTPQQGITYDYTMDVALREINISPERVKEREVYQEKQVKDGKEYLLDDDGEYVLNDKGEKIEVDKLITVHCDYYEFAQSKAVNVVGQVRYKSNTTNQLISSFPLVSEFIFEHSYARYDGDKRALNDDLYALTRKRAVAFPSNEQMVYDAGEDLKRRLKNIIVKQRF